jgi:hypothetical protein
MPSATVEQELLELEKKYWQALKDGDVDTVLQLTDEPCLLTGAQGVLSIDHKTMVGLMKEAPYTMQTFRMTDPQVRMLGDTAAIVAYKVHEELTVEGKKVTIDAADSSTWVRRNGNWVCALHTESIAGDPFGRDRRT